MASELSQLIESELRKAEGANKSDEHQRSTDSVGMSSSSSSSSRPLVPTGKAEILDATHSEHSEPGSPDHLPTDETEYSEDNTPVSEHTIMTVSPLAEGNYDAISAQADDDSELPQTESQERKTALNPNLANAGYPGTAPALSQDIQTVVPALAPSLLDSVISTIQNSTAANAPSPSS
ncbi:MAG: hypothetical protein FRX49_06968 [Trebouxia sp. A1-2]|nr:MAG: hypothetical protein FRX49_06968 [Trebouxia sp. A1-2]